MYPFLRNELLIMKDNSLMYSTHHFPSPPPPPPLCYMQNIAIFIFHSFDPLHVILECFEIMLLFVETYSRNGGHFIQLILCEGRGI